MRTYFGTKDYTYSYDNWTPFRHVDIWDMGRKLMQIEFRVIEGGRHLSVEYDDRSRTRYGRPYTLEIIVRGTNGVHTFADCICDGELTPTLYDRCEIERYVYDWSSTGHGDDFVIANELCQITIHVDRKEDGTLVADVTDQKVTIKRPQWGRFWRRPKALAA